MYPKFKYFAEEDVDLFYEMCDTFHQLHLVQSERNNHFTVNCHSICRALVMFYGTETLTLCDGYISEIVTHPGSGQKVHGMGIHSWLKTTAGSILDPYPVGMYSVFPVFVANGGDDAELIKARYIEDPSVVNDGEMFNAKNIYKQAQYQVSRLELVTGRTRSSSTWIT